MEKLTRMEWEELTARNRMAEECAQASKSKGWHDVQRSDQQLLQLVSTEIAEATEEVRNKKPTIWWMEDTLQRTATLPEVIAYVDGTLTSWKHDELFTMNFPKPEGEIVELADADIRLFDFAGRHSLDLNDVLYVDDLVDLCPKLPAWKMGAFEQIDAADFHFGLNKILALIDDETDKKKKASLISYFIDLTDVYSFVKTGIPVGLVIAMKRKFNDTRPMLHGGKAL